MLPTLTNPDVELPITEETARLVHELICPTFRLVAMIAIEEQLDILIHRRDNQYYCMTVMAGDLADCLIDDLLYLEDAITICEYLGLPYIVEM